MYHAKAALHLTPADVPDEFSIWSPGIQKRYDEISSARLFTTDAKDLFDAYITNLPIEERQTHNCNSCRRFIETYGGLVVIDENGFTASAVWDLSKTTPLYHNAVKAMLKRIAKASVTGVFLTSEKTWGVPETGEWTHLSIKPAKTHIFKALTANAHQAAAAKLEDFRTLRRALDEYPERVLAPAIDLLKTESLYRSEKCLGVAEWLFALQQKRRAFKGTQIQYNILWAAVASAPAGFCTPRSSMIGTLLDDIAANMGFDQIKRRFAEKMDPHQYMRPQSAPGAGNIAQAEKIIAQLGAAGALARRYAKVGEIQALWRPTPIKPVDAPGGVFGHLAPKGRRQDEVVEVDAPPVVMTWEKFKRTVLPTAERIEFLAEGTGNYSALVTAADPEAPPIMQWDQEDLRNPFSWYVYSGGSAASQWHLRAGFYRDVTAVALQPSMWNGSDKYTHHGESVFFILEGCREDNSRSACLFPETLKSEFHSIRATIEAYSRSSRIEGVEEASACGIRLQKGTPWRSTFRVTSGGRQVIYKLDRWD